MKETTGEICIGNEENEQTLPGLGPQLGIESLQTADPESCGPIRLTEEEQMVLEMMRAQADRYDWFAERVDPKRPVEELAPVLLRAPAGPGLWEEALVGLSLSYDETAKTFLEQWQPPADNPELCLFHEICLGRARRSPVGTR